MLIPLEWLKEYVDVPETPEELADRLTVTGNEIEEIRAPEGDQATPRWSAESPVLDLKLTPNRADMLAIRGAAREVAALYGRALRDPAPEVAASGPPEPDVRVDLEAPDLCPRYVARVIRGVKVALSPDWLRQRLEAAGVRSVSNVVDATNYVMLEMGQPLHAFDLELLRGHRIVVRRARPGEPITAIDGTKVTMDDAMLAICDAERPVAIAGVMGGLDSEVSDGTTSVLLESAYFDPTSIRRTAKRVGISSPASYRFERGVDPEGTLRAADRAAALIVELAGGTVSETVIDAYPEPYRAPVIRYRPQRARKLLGAEIPDGQQAAFLERLGIGVEQAGDEWRVTAPSWRPDIAIEEDLIEEAGRLFGYDRLPETLCGGASAGARSPLDTLIRNVRQALTAQGLYEAVTSTLISSEFLQKSRLQASPVWPAGGGEMVRLRNPLSDEYNTLRPSLLPGLLLACEHNLRRGTADVYLFEAGYAHSQPGGAPRDRVLVSGLLLGSRWSHVWNPDKQSAVDFFSAKGAVEALALALGLGPLATARSEHTAFHPGRSAWLSVDGERLGVVGELHPDLVAELDLPRGIYLFELDGEVLLCRSTPERAYLAPSRYPRALRDLAVVVPESVASADIEAVLREAMGDSGRTVRLFDVYSGKPLAEGKVSLAYALEMGSEERTLTDAEVDGRIDEARRQLQARFGAEFRG